ncbi:MAG TPA: Hsp33 family molecular chaperone HslO, partial [Deinococcales bacterium]|nr:Hsp33 family molecular chaperone HslO [Deinococcales bacterium]
MSSFLIRGTAAADTLRVTAVDSTALVAEAMGRHGTSLTATAALGRTLSAALLLSQLLTKDEPGRVGLRVQGGGPVGWIVAEGSRDGTARGYVRNPEAELPPRDSDGKL